MTIRTPFIEESEAQAKSEIKMCQMSWSVICWVR